MNRNSQLFSHQRALVERLSTKFQETTVISAERKTIDDPKGVNVLCTNWEHNRTVRNIINFLRISFKTVLHLKKSGDVVVLSHMTDLQALLISPLTKLLGIRHYLWYAHKKKSLYLRLSYPLLTGILTSTAGSCPLNGKKVFPIGQAIDIDQFKRTEDEPRNPPLRWYTVGRIDPSKNLEMVVSAVKKLRKSGVRLRLDIFGEPSSLQSQEYASKLKQRYSDDINESWLKFRSSVLHDSLPFLANNYDGFIHAFMGSLDKSVLEATASRRLVATTNPEYIEDFGLETAGLEYQLGKFIRSDLKTNRDETLRRLDILASKHSAVGWLEKISTILRFGHT